MLFNANLKTRRELMRWQSEHRARLLRLAWSWCGDVNTAEDLVQEACRRGLKSRAELRDPRKLHTWMTRIMYRVWLDQLKSPRQRLEELEDFSNDYQADQASPEQLADARQQALRVRSALAKLSPPQRQVITLVDLEELSYAECAEVLEVPVGTVMSRLNRGRNALKQLLKNGDPKPAVQLRRVK